MWLSMEYRQDFQPRSPFLALGQVPSCDENTAQRRWAETRYSLDALHTSPLRTWSHMQPLLGVWVWGEGAFIVLDALSCKLNHTK